MAGLTKLRRNPQTQTVPSSRCRDVTHALEAQSDSALWYVQNVICHQDGILQLAFHYLAQIDGNFFSSLYIRRFPNDDSAAELGGRQGAFHQSDRLKNAEPAPRILHGKCSGLCNSPDNIDDGRA